LQEKSSAHDVPSNTKAGVEGANRMFATGTPNPPLLCPKMQSHREVFKPSLAKNSANKTAEQCEGEYGSR